MLIMAICTHWVYPKENAIPHFEMIMCSYERGDNIEIRIEHKDHINAPVTRHYWDMKLWRWNPAAPGYNSNMGTWKLGGTRTGYVSRTSPSSRTFTNCKPGWWYALVRYTNGYSSAPDWQAILFKHGTVIDPMPGSRPAR